MDNLYIVLSKKNIGPAYLRELGVNCFSELFVKYENKASKIVKYLNECYNFKSPFLIDEKVWVDFLEERFLANELDEELRKDIIELRSPEIAFAADEFLILQQKREWQTLVTKENLRLQMIKQVQDFALSISEKKSANDLITELDEEINFIKESMRNDQKIMGNYAGFDAVKKAKQSTVINITNI